MKAINVTNSKLQSLTAVVLLTFMFGFSETAAPVFAHGGEDHGDTKATIATNQKGMLTRTARLGDVEVLLKHPLLEPDTTATASLFITKFATNEPFGDANPAVEIKPANGSSVTEIAVEKTDANGSYVLKIPAFPEGAYTIRVKANVGGKIDTTTFSGVEIAHQEAATANSGGSWLQTLLAGFLFLIALALFGGLIYLAVKVIKNTPVSEETVSA